MLEVQALLAGLILAKQGKYQRLHIEGDSAVIINACIHRKIYSWKLKYIFNQVWKQLDEFQDICISHIFQEGNRVVDHLSNLGCDGVHFSSLNPQSIIEKYEDLKNIIDMDNQ